MWVAGKYVLHASYYGHYSDKILDNKAGLFSSG